MKLLRVAEASAWLLTAGLLTATVAWPGWSVQSARNAARLAAQSTLERVVAREHRLLTEHGRFAGFGPRGAERKEVMGEVELGRDGRLFDVDALLDEAGHLHIRVISRPEMIRNGDVAPVMEQVELEPVLPAPGT